MAKKTFEVVHEWQGLNPHEAIIWAHLRLDRLERHIGLTSELPDLKDIIDKLHNEATSKEAYPPQPKPSVLYKFFTKPRILSWYPSLRYFINRILRLDKGYSQNNTANKGKEKTDDVKDTHQ